MIALFNKYNNLQDHIPHVALGNWPSPVYSVSSLANELNIKSLYVKCDGRSGPLYGGNKVRKLEFILGHVLKKNIRSVYTLCTIGTHHGLATSLYGKSIGLHTELIQIPQPVDQHVRDQILAIASSGAKTRLIKSPTISGLYITGRRLLNALHLSGSKEYYIPPGGSSAHGALGFVNAAYELAQQINEGLCPEPDIIYIPFSTVGTYTGLWLGSALAGLKSKIIGIRVADPLLSNKLRVRMLAYSVLKILRGANSHSFPYSQMKRPIYINHNHVGQGYGHSTEEADAAIKLIKSHTDQSLEPVYTGKTFAALISDASSGQLKDKHVLFWNTYNQLPLDDLISSTSPDELSPSFQTYFNS